ncbi:capsular polysaccharide biosynthesis protein [Microvirga sp. TS319]|uniref:capsular polysaccharide biosynthesis protein n=1 Tax=Microvirga sp. TS319 TaxID=3241165 RepID=UPI00351AA78C
MISDDYLPPSGQRLAAATSGLCSTPHFPAFFSAEALLPLRARADCTGIVGWGLKRSSQRAKKLAAQRGLPFWHLEDGFLRSVGLGKSGAPTVSIVVDDLSIYYQAEVPSRLETLIAGGSSEELRSEAAALRDLIQRERLTKYNANPDRALNLGSGDKRPRILLVDQVRGDLSVAGALSDSDTFARMLLTARTERPGARLIARIHPDVQAGYARGYLAGLAARYGIEVLSDDVSPHAVLDAVDEVWTVSSQLGFEALMRGLPVTCFGVPFYAGWGATQDRADSEKATQVLVRRRSAGSRDILDITAAALLVYTRYADPIHHRALTAWEAIDRLLAWRRHALERTGTYICHGFTFWKRPVANLYLGGPFSTIRFATRFAQPEPTNANATTIIWGMTDRGVQETAARHRGQRVVRMEDGFVRSVGLGSSFILPASVCLDDIGLYFDARRPSRLEALIMETSFNDNILRRARRVRERLVHSGLTKYNLGSNIPPNLLEFAGKRPIVLVTGQVETDASITYGAQTVCTNLALLQAARQAEPEAFLVYKEHPDVAAGHRRGRIDRRIASTLADIIVDQGDINGWLKIAKSVHVITSLTGFEALLRGCSVTCWGTPFYAGWGLTDDKADTTTKRTRQLTLDELVAAALILYPRYADPRSGLPCEIEDVLDLLEKGRSGPLTYPLGTPMERQMKRAASYLRAQTRAMFSS